MQVFHHASSVRTANPTLHRIECALQNETVYILSICGLLLLGNIIFLIIFNSRF